MSQYASKNFIKIEHVRDKPLRATISDVEIGEKYDRPILDLGRAGRLSCNATNVATLIKAYGEDSRDWIGCEVELYLGRTTFQGQERDSVLIKPLSPDKPDAKRETRRPVDTSRKPKDDMDDEIPF